MNLTDYLQKPISERKQIVSVPVGIKDQFWLERLKTAFKFSSPLSVSLHKILVDEYWILKKS